MPLHHAVSYACSQLCMQSQQSRTLPFSSSILLNPQNFISVIYNTYQLICHPRQQPREEQQRPTLPSHKAKRKNWSRTTRPRPIRKRLQPKRKSPTLRESAGESYARIYAPEYCAILNPNLTACLCVFVIVITSLQEGIRFSKETWLRYLISSKPSRKTEWKSFSKS